MAGSREAQFKRGTIEARTLHGWQVGAADGYDCEVEDFAELELSHYRLTKREEKRLRLAEIIDRLNDLYGAEASDDDKLHFANGIADRIERDEALMALVRNHSEDQVMHGLFPKKVTDAVLRPERPREAQHATAGG